MKRQRQSIRLRNYDYSQAGAYFVTVCMHERQCLLGEIAGDKVEMNNAGRSVWTAWKNIPQHYPGVGVDEFVVMPNHVHGILILGDRAGLKPAPTKKSHGLSEIVRAFKTFSAREINKSRGMTSAPVWQRSYYERVIRDKGELNRIRRYIVDNPVMWAMDRNNPTVESVAKAESWQV